MKDIKSHRRVNDIFLGPLERPALKWLAAHMPAWVNPDILTYVGLSGSILIASSYALTNLHPAFLWLACLGFFINWFGDSLDGTLARYRHIERPRYGFFIDHTIDAFSVIMIVLGIGLSPFVRFDLACLAVIGYLLLGNLVYIRTCLVGEFRISYGKLGPTEVRVILVLTNIVVYFTHNPSFTSDYGSLSLYDWVVILLTFLLFYFSIRHTILQAREFAKLGEQVDRSP
jgi:phosphatidylglycerophosphate synthase